MEEQLKNIKAADIVGKLSIIENSSEIVAETQFRVDYEAMEAHLRVKEYAKKLEERERWCRNLLWLVRIGFVFSMTTTIALGLGWLEFQSSAVTVPVAIGAGFLSTYGLAKIAVNYLFDGNKTK
jgi:hypothetical protein